MKTLKVTLTFTDEVLGTIPGDPELFTAHVAPDFPDDAEKLPKPEDLDEAVEKGTTYFYLDDDGNQCIRAYQIKGFFKDAAGMLRRIEKTVSKTQTAYKKLIDGLIFIGPDDIPLQIPKGKSLGFCERPLRASTPQGDRVALARSQSAPAGTVIEFEIKLLQPKLEKWVRELLEYGELRGLCQWRNSGKGRFTCKIK